MSNFGFDDAPPPEIDECRDLLLDLAYPPERANACAIYGWIQGTFEGCPDFLGEEARQACQELLNGCCDLAWQRFDDYVWVTSEHVR